MKLATYKDGSRDGQLVVVSRDLSTAHFAAGIATRLQPVLDDWNYLSPQLEDLYQTLNGGKARHAFPFEPARCMAPLPRTARWAEAAAYPSSEAGVRPARKAKVSDSDAPAFVHDAGDDLLGALDDARLRSERHGIDFGASLAVVTGDISRGAGAAQALEGVRLVMLANVWRFAAADARPAPAFGPVAVTPDELGAAWREGRVHGWLDVALNDRGAGSIDTAAGQRWDFGTLLAAVAEHRHLRAGAVVGGGVLHGSADGAGCLAERRARETAEHGEPRTPFLRDGDRVRLMLRTVDGDSPLGAIAQTVAVAQPD